MSISAANTSLGASSLHFGKRASKKPSVHFDPPRVVILSPTEIARQSWRNAAVVTPVVTYAASKTGRPIEQSVGFGVLGGFITYVATKIALKPKNLKLL